MSRDEWKDHYEAVSEVEGYKSIDYSCSEAEEIEIEEKRIKFEAKMRFDEKKAIEDNYTKSRKARKRRLVRQMILKSRSDRYFGGSRI